VEKWSDFFAARSLVILTSVFLFSTAVAQTQLGTDIDGERFDHSGWSVSLTAEGSRLAIGSPYSPYSDTNGSYSGQTRVYQWSGSSWQQLGADINGEGETDNSGWSVSLSADGNRLAIGSHFNSSANGYLSGQTRVYQWSGSSWQQLGTDIDGKASRDVSGWSVTLSADGSRLAIGTDQDAANGFTSGRVRVYQWSGSVWQQLGTDIDDPTGQSVALSANGERLAIGAPGDGSSSFDFGHARVYQWSGSAWQQLGADIDGEGAGDDFGFSVSLSADGSRIAIGAPYNDDGDIPYQFGKTQVYQWSGSAWQQLGTDIVGEDIGERSGRSVSLSADGKHLAIGSYGYSANDHNSGRTRVYRWSGSAWQQHGADIDGEAESDLSGWSVSLSADGSRIAIGAPGNSANGDASGHVRVFENSAPPTQSKGLVGLEVVQVIQDWNNSVPLVANKTTKVRAHIEDAAGPTIADFTFRLYGFDELDQPLEPAFIENGKLISGLPGGGEELILPINVDTNSRGTNGFSALFHLPLSWTNKGTKKYVFEASSNPSLLCKDQAPPANNDCSVSVEYTLQNLMNVHTIRTKFTQKGGEDFITEERDLKRICHQILGEFPTHEITCTFDPNPIIIPTSMTWPKEGEILRAVTVRKRSSGCWWPYCEDFYLAVTKFGECEEQNCTNWSTSGMAVSPLLLRPWGSRSAWAVDDSESQTTAAHELGHNLGLHHTTNQDLNHLDLQKDGTCKEKARFDALYPPSDSYYFPYYNGNDPILGPLGSDQAVVFGYDTEWGVESFSTNALMSYCGNIGSFDIASYNLIFQELTATETAGASAVTAVENTSEYFFVSGTVDKEMDAATFYSIEVLMPPFVPLTPTTGDWELIIHFSAEADVTHPLVLSTSPNSPSLADFSAFVGFDPTIIGFTVQRDGVPLEQVSKSNNAPQISLTSLPPNAEYKDEEVVLEWSASDADGDELTFMIDYSPDGGGSWITLSSNWAGSPFTVNSSLIQPSLLALFRVTALDGFNSATDMLQGTIQIHLPNLVLSDGFE